MFKNKLDEIQEGSYSKRGYTNISMSKDILNVNASKDYGSVLGKEDISLIPVQDQAGVSQDMSG